MSVDSDIVIYNALKAYNATKTLADDAATPYVVFAIDKETSRARDRVYKEQIELVIDIVTDTATEGDAIEAGILANLGTTDLIISRYGSQDSVIEEKFLKTIDFTLVNII